jgi:hypothetical protein
LEAHPHARIGEVKRFEVRLKRRERRRDPHPR